MYILNGSELEVVNTDFVERFCVVRKDDAALIVASYSSERPPVTLARYAGVGEAKAALRTLFYDLAGDGEAVFEMPESSLYGAEPVRHDARTKRRGGS